MPPIRWQFLTVLALFLIYFSQIAKGNHNSPLTSNGWRPIVVDRYEKRGQIISEASNIVPQVVENSPKRHNGQNNQQRVIESQNKKFNSPNQFQQDGFKPPSSQNLPESQRDASRGKEPSKTQGNHINFMKSNQGKIRVNHHGSTGHHSKHASKLQPHKPISQMHMSKGPPRHSNQNQGKGNPHQGSGKRPTKKQPYRTQATAHSQKEEIIAPAPSSGLGTYTFFNQGPFNIRDTQIGANKPFHPQDFRTHFPNIQASNSEAVHVHHGFGFGKPQNELQYFNQNDDYTRNLVPPPPAKIELKEAEKTQQKQFLLKPMDDLRGGFIQGFNYERPDLEITKERIREYHTTVAPPVFSKGTTEAYSTIKFSNRPQHFYEVTEDKRFQENSPFFQYRPTTPIRFQTYPTALPELSQNYQETTQFLPTPFIDAQQTFPTMHPQEVSTIYSEVKYRQNPNQNQYQPNHFNIKEVATHFPIFEIKSPVLQSRPESPVLQSAPRPVETITRTTTQLIEETTTTEAPRSKPTRRQNPRRRRPSTTTTTEAYEAPEMEVTERPLRRRRPMKPRTTEAPRRRPQVEEEENYPPNFPVREVVTENYPQVRPERPQETRKFEESVHSYRVETEPTTTEYPRPTALQYSDEPVETTTLYKKKRIRTTTEEPIPTSFKTENELDYTTSSYSQEVVTEEPSYKQEAPRYEEPKYEEPVTILTTTSTTTTTEAPKTHRIRRPFKYDNLRPRFSVKDYKQKFAPTSSTTEINKITTPVPIGRIKYPSRFTKEPSSQEDETEMLRFRFKPKDPRHRQSSTESGERAEPTTEKTYKIRTRPFRTRPTESTTTTTPKVSIKPNIFNNLKRPQQIGLRTRILNKKNLTTTEAPVTTEEASIEEVTLPVAENHMEVTTESFRRILDNTSPDYEEGEDNEGEQSPDDAFLHLQRITELTSQAKNNHFKTMSTASRRVPSYFTISTDDPILPIEAFFSKINQ